MFLRLLQLRNALSSIFVTLENVTVVKELLANAELPIVVILSGKEMLVRP